VAHRPACSYGPARFIFCLVTLQNGVVLGAMIKFFLTEIKKEKSLHMTVGPERGWAASSCYPTAILNRFFHYFDLFSINTTCLPQNCFHPNS